MSDLTPAPQQNIFERIRRTNEHGSEFWSARELAKVLDNSYYRQFQSVIAKAREA